MASPSRAVLIDTNVILEAWRVRGWKALAGRHGLETVATVVMETHTGFQRRAMTRHRSCALPAKTVRGSEE